MNSVTDTLLRRAVCQAVSLVRSSSRGVFTDQARARPAGAALADVPNSPSRDLDSDTQCHKTIMDLPGPDGYPIVGTAPEYFRKANRGQMHEVQRRFHAKYGRMFKERLGPVLNVSIADPKLIEDIFRNEGKYPIRPPYEAWLIYKEMRKRSKGIMSASGEEWHKIRSLLNKRLLKPRQSEQYVADLSSIAVELSDKLRTVRDRDQTDHTIPDILNVLYAWSIESIGQVILNERFGCLLKDMPQTMVEFVAAIENMMHTSHQLMVFGNVHKKLNTKPWRVHVESWDTIIEVAKTIIDSKRSEIEARVGCGGEGELHDATLLEAMLTNEKLNMEEVYTNMTELLLSGIDTTSNTVAVAVYLMSQHPHVQQSLQQEADDLFRDSDRLTADHLKRMPYIKAFVKEVLRFYPTIPTNARVLAEDTKINGYLLPKNTIIMLNTFTMCRDDTEFKNPDEFLPERWLRGEVREFSPFTSLPFGFGARSCVGRRIAETMIYFTIANIARRFHLEPVENAQSLKPFVRTVLTLGNDLPVEFKDR